VTIAHSSRPPSEDPSAVDSREAVAKVGSESRRAACDAFGAVGRGSPRSSPPRRRARAWSMGIPRNASRIAVEAS